jgi:hypothetical protein
MQFRTFVDRFEFTDSNISNISIVRVDCILLGAVLRRSHHKLVLANSVVEIAGPRAAIKVVLQPSSTWTQSSRDTGPVLDILLAYLSLLKLQYSPAWNNMHGEACPGRIIKIAYRLMGSDRQVALGSCQL